MDSDQLDLNNLSDILRQFLRADEIIEWNILNRYPDQCYAYGYVQLSGVLESTLSVRALIDISFDDHQATNTLTKLQSLQVPGIAMMSYQVEQCNYDHRKYDVSFVYKVRDLDNFTNTLGKIVRERFEEEFTEVLENELTNQTRV